MDEYITMETSTVIEIITDDLGFTNETMYPDDFDDQFLFESYTERIVLAVLYCIVTIVGVVGNSVVILAVAFSRRLRSTTNWLVINLALADLLTCLSLPFGVTALLSRNGWPLPDWVCSLSAAIGFVCIGVSVMTLALIAHNRWYLLTQPRTKFVRVYSIRNILIMLAVVWLYAFLLVVAPHFAGLGQLGYSPQYKFCWHDTTVPTSDYYSLLAGPGLILPFSIFIIVVYVRIYVFVSRHNKVMRDSVHISTARPNTLPANPIQTKQQKTELVITSLKYTKKNAWRLTGSQNNQSISNCDQQKSFAVSADFDSLTESGVTYIQQTSTSPSSCSGDVGTAGFSTVERRKIYDKKTRSRQYRHHVSVTKRLSIVVVAFFVCLLPFGISSVLPNSDPGIPWTGLMTTFNCFLNPIIYAWTMPVFRRVMACIIFCRFRNIPNPSRFVARISR